MNSIWWSAHVDLLIILSRKISFGCLLQTVDGGGWVCYRGVNRTNDYG